MPVDVFGLQCGEEEREEEAWRKSNRFKILYVLHLLLSNMGVISAHTDDSQVTVYESKQMYSIGLRRMLYHHFIFI